MTVRIDLDALPQNFLTWLKQQDRDASYNYVLPNSCALALYLKTLGMDRPGVDPNNFGPEDRYRVPAVVEQAVLGPSKYLSEDEAARYWTFGQAADRLSLLLEEAT